MVSRTEAAVSTNQLAPISAKTRLLKAFLSFFGRVTGGMIFLEKEEGIALFRRTFNVLPGSGG